MAFLLTGLGACGARGFIVEEQLIDDGVGGGTGGSGSLGGAGGNSSLGGSGGGGGSGARGGGGGRGGSQSNPPEANEPYHFETRALARCELGFTWSPGDSRSCTFRFNGRCYDDEDAVCACACPRDANSICALSGFLSDPDNPLMVTCTAKP